MFDYDSDDYSDDDNYCGKFRTNTYYDVVCQGNLQRLKILREKVNWDVEDERRKFLRQLFPLTKVWFNRLPNLREIFRTEEIDWLLSEYVKNVWEIELFTAKEIPLVDFVIRTGYKDEPELDEDGKPILRRTTALHHAAKRDSVSSLFVPLLFEIYDRFDVNYTDESGFTHFHAACQFGLEDVVKKFLELGQDPNCLPQELDSSIIDPPLCLVLKYGHSQMFKWLLESGADPNLADTDGLTPLHFICQMDYLNYLLNPLFEISNANHYQVQIDVQDKLGNTPLHLALHKSRNKMFKLLLERGVNPNLVNNDGSTPLHIICKRDRDDDLAKIFLEINNANHQTVPLDDTDKLGRTPLHLALAHGHKKLAEFLIRRGASSNLADAEGLTSLHMICKQDNLAGFLTKFFEINHEVNQLVEVNVEDKKGRTPLQWAVASLHPDVIEVLLNRGADFSSFIFPTESHFDEVVTSLSYKCIFVNELVSSILDIVERLERRGYQLDRSDARTIIKLFAKHGFFEKSSDFSDSIFQYEYFESETKNVKITSSLTLYDLIRLQHEEATKLFTITDILPFVRSNKISRLRHKYNSECKKYLFEIMALGFCRPWILEFFLLLTSYQLPILCCEKIIGHLKVEDFWRVCLAVPDQRN